MRGGLALAVIAALATPATCQETWERPGDEAHVETTGPAPEPWTHDQPTWPVRARLEGPTDRYVHGVLGGIPMFARLHVTARACGACRHASEGTWAALPDDMVFEDAAPRLWDVDGDARPEIVVVEAHVARGARLAVWDYPRHDGHHSTLTRRAATPYIGQPQRWLAPAGAGDFDGDGRPEIAWVDRPHLAQVLVFGRLQGDAVVEIARVPGLTNHRIGDTAITATTRSCYGVTEVIVPDADWRRFVAVRLDGARPVTRDAGAVAGPGSLARAARCPAG
jgi:FG-GAP-like repeat